MGNTLGTHMGNTFGILRCDFECEQELMHTLSQAPKGQKYGVCDEGCSSSVIPEKRGLSRADAEKVLPMSMPRVLPMCVPHAVRANP